MFWGTNTEQEVTEISEYEQVKKENDRVFAKIAQNQGSLRCEELLSKEKHDYGRIRQSLMDVLRVTYGEETANRAKGRVNQRFAKKAFQGKMITKTIL